MGVFALGITDTQEAEAVLAHVPGCAECRAELRELRATVDALPLAVPPMDPPPALRSRIETAILAEAPPAAVRPALAPTIAPVIATPRVIVKPVSFWSSARPWAALAAALLLFAAGMVVWNLRLQDQLTAIPAPQTIALAATDAAPGASGEVRYDPTAQLFLLNVRDLPELAEGQVYEVWLIGSDGVPSPAGVFDQTTDVHAIAADRGQYDTLAITAEPGPLGGAAPTGEIVATATL